MMSGITCFFVGAVFEPFEEHERHHVTEKWPKEQNSGYELQQNRQTSLEKSIIVFFNR